MTSVCKWLCILVALLRFTADAGESLWQRVVVIGASASSGFVLSEPLGGTNTDKCRLTPYLDAAITTPHDPLKNLSSAMLFLSPETIAAQEVEAATNRHPTLVIGVDFLFWFCYGEGRTDAERAARFEYGLRLLDRVHCPLLVGDIPDASSATNSGILGVAQIPSDRARAAANRRLREWATARPDVTVVPLDAFMSAVKANQAIVGNNISVPAGQTYRLLQADRLHPNCCGAALLSLGILDALVSRHREIPTGDVLWNLNEVRQRGLLEALSGRRSYTASATP